MIAAAGPKKRTLPTSLPPDLLLPEGYHSPQVAMPGVLVVQGPPFQYDDQAILAFSRSFYQGDPIEAFPLIVVADDAEFTAHDSQNFLWVTFTRSNPAVDIDGVMSSTKHKHWGCKGSLVIDARIKPHHAPPLEEDPEVVRKVEEMAAPGKPLHGLF